MFNRPTVKIVKLKFDSRYQRLFNKDSCTLGIRAGHVLLKAGDDIGSHTTGALEEILIILKGKGELSAGKDSRLKIEEGSVLYIPPDTEHNVKNTGKTLLEYVFVTSMAAYA